MKLLIAFLLLNIGIIARAGIVSERVFHTITALDGLADNSAQTLKCTRTGRMTISTIGTINFYDGAYFSRIPSVGEEIYRLENYKGHYHLYFDNNHHLWLKNHYQVSCVNLYLERYDHNIDSIFAQLGARGRVDDMFVDMNGDVWLCEGGYIFCGHYMKKVALKKENLQDLEVYDKRYLMLFYENGLLITYDLKAGHRLYSTYAYSKDDAAIYSHSGVQLFYENGFYMIRNGEKGAILVHFNIDTRQWTEVMRSDYHLNNMVIHDNLLYIASEWGYFTYDLESGEIVHQKSLTLQGGRKLETDINTIEFDLQGGMWLGTEKRGLLYGAPVNAPFHLLTWDNPLALKYDAMMEPLEGISEFRGKRAHVMLLDSRQWTWVGTPNGLYMYTSPKAEPVVFSSRNGLLNSVIHSVIEDDFGNIWISTSYGICCIRIKDGSVKQVYCFSQSDNVPNETFIKAKAMKLPSGEIVMQAIDHMLIFNPAEFQEMLNQEPYEMHPKLTKLLVNGVDVTAGDAVNGKVVLDKAITRTREINLNYDQNSISMTFSALNYSRPLQTYYRVRIKELSNDWIEYSYFSGSGLVDRRGLLHLPLSGLKPGTYHVELLTSVVRGKYVGKPYEWIINVNQPWWRTTGVLALFTLIVLILAVLNFIVYNRNTRLREKRNNEESDVIRRIKVFVSRNDNLDSEKMAPTPEEIYGNDVELQSDLSPEFVDVMSKIITYIHQLQGRAFTMHMLSAAVDMDLLKLYDLISENIHKSPRSLVRSQRLDKVAEMLTTTDKSIEEVSSECGFISPNYMISKFYHKFRMTPFEYRQHHSQ